MKIIPIILAIVILFLLIKYIFVPLKENLSNYIDNLKYKKQHKRKQKTINNYTEEIPHISFYKDDKRYNDEKYYQKEQIKKYESKSLLTKNEMYFFNVISENFKDYLIQPQVNLATIIEKHKDYPTQYQNELFRNIDIGIFDKKTTACLLLIEINDKSHNQNSRIRRDIKVKEICEDAGLNLITFHTKYENRPEYIVGRIKKELKR